MRPFIPFALEEYMSRFEQEVEINLSESGVDPVRLGEFMEISGTDPGFLLGLTLGYPHVDGIPELREAIAAMHGAAPDQVLVTVGAAEANHVVTRTLVGPGDGTAMMVPNYLQAWGIARNDGAVVTTFRLDPGRGWALDLESLEAAVGPDTRMIAVCHPNNPTGKALTAGEMEAVVAAAERSGAWLLADEVYRGAERAGEAETPSFWGRAERVVAVGSMSKAYGMPGLRVGWAVGPRPLIQEAWRRHEYTAISASMLGNHLAAIALRPDVRPRLLARTRGLIRAGYPVLEGWVGSHPGRVSVRPPDAAAIAFVRCDTGEDAAALAHRIRREHRVLVVPGPCFGVEGHLRISYGLDPDLLAEGLRRIGEAMASG